MDFNLEANFQSYIQTRFALPQRIVAWKICTQISECEKVRGYRLLIVLHVASDTLYAQLYTM